MRKQIHPRQKGFTLVEMAVVLVIIGLVMLIVYPALNAMRVSTQRHLTDSHLQDLLRSVAVYVQAAGCLPCPTPANATGANFGRVRGDTNAALCGGCAQPEGIPPFVSLGIPENSARDGWQRWITMRVDPALTVNFGIVPPTAVCTASDVAAGICTQTGVSQKGLCTKDLSKLPLARPITITMQDGSTAQPYAIVLVSHGPNGYGAYNAGVLSGSLTSDKHPSLPKNIQPCLSNKGFESCNADGNAVFVNAPQKIDNNDPFDDSLVYLDRNNLVSLLGNGSCQTVW